MKPTGRRFLLSGALALLVLAGLLYGGAIQTRSATGAPIRGLPIDLRPGETITPEFSVPREGRYSITLYLDRDPVRRDFDCLLGVALDPARCGDTASPLDLSWTLYVDGSPDRQGRSPPRGMGSWSGRRVGNSFGEFDASPGHRYRLRIESRRDASALAPARPEITVSRSIHEAKGLVANAALSAIAAIAAAGLAAAMLLALLASHLLGRSRVRHADDVELPGHAARREGAAATQGDTNP